MAKILVIDDERAIRNTLKDILEFEGYTVEVAENGRVGLECALSSTFDLIFTDIKMPEMDGLEFLQTYRNKMQEQNSEESPIIMITGHGSVDTAVDALKSGAFYTKTSGSQSLASNDQACYRASLVGTRNQSASQESG